MLLAMGHPPRQIIGNISGESVGQRKRDRTGASNSVTFFGSFLDELTPTDHRNSTARPAKKQKPTLRSGIPVIRAGSATVRKINAEEKKMAKEDLKRTYRHAPSHAPIDICSCRSFGC